MAKAFSIGRDLICLGFALCEGKKDDLVGIGRVASAAMKWRNDEQTTAQSAFIRDGNDLGVRCARNL
jgi:hypothetical protein